MSAKELHIHCPCCQATLIVDAATGGILKHTAFKQEGPSLEEFLRQDKSRSQDLAAKFAEAKHKEDTKLDFLNKKFEWARKNKDKLKDAPKPDIHWD